ncbi:hypothetical protein B0J12DRAFT_342485 [Macrophomina phaseolina]|uniref:C2H2-type domain-containing protein n=1 Tax=Macrophomina phaseolina TaxID=35725 RepID=A0ABQ8GQ67_9PEZI|nr:hypothetical protein B0J12DRAFT_342485 [Macrophomina phaseolina]
MNRRQESKGKGDAAPPRGNGKEPEQPMSSRIAASASGLAKDLLGGGGADEAQSALGTGSGLSRKLSNRAGAAGPSTWAQTLPSRHNGSSSRANTGSGETFRSQEGLRDPVSTSEPLADYDFEAFLNSVEPANLSGEDSFQWSHEFNGDSSLSHAHNGFPAAQEQLNRAYHLHDQVSSTYRSTNAYGDYDDGAEVRLLLSDPAFSMDDQPDVPMADPTPESINDLFGQNYTAEEKEIVDKIKSSLPPPPQYNGVPPDNPLNLRPEFASLSASNPHLEQEIAELSRALGSGMDHLMAFSDAQRQRFLAEWDDVLNNYTDEVWGEMLPVVKAARSQLQEVKTGMDSLDSKAVARLRMILGHVVDTKQTISTASSVTQEQSAAQRHVLDSGMQDLRQLHRPVNQYNSINGHDYAVQQPSHQRAVHGERHLQKEQKTPEEDVEWDAPTFHCPYVSCHEQFRNESELRMHSKEHNGLLCPHFDCADRFEDSKEWADHINRSHHGLVKPRPEDEDVGL